jgi:hypothetical protein
VIQSIFYFILFYFILFYFVLFYFIYHNFVYFKFIILYCIVCWASFTTHTPKMPCFHVFVIFIAASKRIKICYKGTDRFVAETLLYLLYTQI